MRDGIPEESEIPAVVEPTRCWVVTPCQLPPVSARRRGIVPSKSIKNEKQYEALRDKGMSKERAARISNSPGSSKRGGQKSGRKGGGKK